MNRPTETASLFREGFSPSGIAEHLGISLSSVLGYLARAVGEGHIRRSDIYFAFPPEQRSLVALAQFADARCAYGDLYDDVRRIELDIHQRIRTVLVSTFGDGETGWWRQGVPEGVRRKCTDRRESDSDPPCDPYCYTDLSDLSKILESQWSLFMHQVPSCYRSNRKALLDDLMRFGRIRNKVMHPVRGVEPSEEDFDFVHGFERRLLSTDAA